MDSQGVSHILDLVLVEVGDTVDDHPRNGAPKIHKLMHSERHDSSRQDIILHECIPGGPQAFEDIEMNVVFRNLVELTPVGVRGRVEETGGSGIPSIKGSAWYESIGR